MQKTLLRKWILISVAFIAASSLVLVAASRLGGNAQAGASASTTSTTASDSVTNSGQTNPIGATTSQPAEPQSGQREDGGISRASREDEDDDDEHEALEHSGRTRDSR